MVDARKKKQNSKTEESVLKTKKSFLSIKEIKEIRHAIEESPTNYNQLTKLLKCLKSVSKQMNESNMVLIRVIINEIYEIFATFCSKRYLRITKSESENQRTVSKWIIGKYEEFQNILFKIWALETESETLASVKLDILEVLMKCVRNESIYNGYEKGQPYFPVALYKNIIMSLLTSGSTSNINETDFTIDDYLLLEFEEVFFSKYWDLKYYFFFIMKDSIIDDVNNDSEDDIKLIVSKVLTLLKLNELYESEDAILDMGIWATNAEKNTIHAINYFNLNFEKFMIKLISLPIGISEYEGILNILHKRIIPYMNEPQRLLDFLSSIYTYGIEKRQVTLSILALNGLWELMKSNNLEYPDFYKNLYAVLTPDFLHAEQSARFFRLLELFMSSTHLPAATVASFIKRLARLCLSSPPSGIICCVPFIYNLLKLHPTCMLLIHAQTSEVEYVDPYNLNETDPSKSNALGSSLWEMSALLNHYHPNVSSLVKIFTQVFYKQRYNMEDFYYWNYKKLLEQESSKNLKGEIGLEFEQWSSLLVKQDENEEQNSFLSGWTY